MSGELQRILIGFVPILLWLTVVLGVTLLVTAVSVRLLATIRDSRNSLCRAAGTTVSRTKQFYEPRIRRYWTSLTSEPKAAVASELARIGDAVPTAGDRAVKHLEQTETRLRESIQALTEIAVLERQLAGIEPADFFSASDDSDHGWGGIVAYAVLAALLGAANVFLLNEFFAAFISAQPLLPVLLPDLRISHVLAFLIFVIEVIIGVAIHQMMRESREPDIAKQILALAPWITLVFLIVLEGAAYGTLSAQINLPELLQISSDSPFFGLARFFMAGLGVGISLLLATMGYQIGAAWDGLARTRSRRRLRKTFETYSATIAYANDQVERTRRDLKALQEEASRFSTEISRDAAEVILGDREEEWRVPLPDLIAAAVDKSLQTLRSVVTEEAQQLRTKRQALSDVLVLALSGIAGLVVIWLSLAYLHDAILDLVGSVTGAEAVAWTLACAATIVPVGAGLVGRSLWGPVHRGSVLPSLISGAIPRRMTALAAIAALFLAATGLVGVSVTYETAGAGVLLNLLLGLIHTAALVGIGAVTQEAVGSLWDVAQLSALGVVRASGLAVALLFAVLSAALGAIAFLIRLIATFGRLILRSSEPHPQMVAETSNE